MKFLWKTYLLPIIDYCSQMYGPSSGSGLLKLENLQKAFTSKISGIGHLSYWDRLKKLKIYSITRRFERYKLIYVHKIINGQAHNCDLTWKCTDNAGLMLDLVHVKDYSRIQREQSFHYIGPRLHNVLPRYIRDDRKSTPDEWKKIIDTFLSKIPDTPLTTDEIPGLCNYDSLPTNSIIYWIPHLHLDDRRGNQKPKM